MCMFGHRLAFWGARPARSLGFWSHLHDSDSRPVPLTQRPAGGLASHLWGTPGARQVAVSLPSLLLIYIISSQAVCRN